MEIRSHNYRDIFYIRIHILPNRNAEPVFPTQGPISRPVPVVRFTFSAKVMLATTSCAFAYASVQAGDHPPGGAG